MGISARLFAGFAAAAGVVQLANAEVIARNGSPGCNHNNCLRAVIASAYTTRSGLADCNSYLLTTISLPTSTVTDCVTVTDSITLPSLTISTEVIDATETSTVMISTTTTTPTTTNLVVKTTTVKTTTDTTTFKTSTKTTTVKGGGPWRRDDGGGGGQSTLTIVPSNIPTYASACSPLSAAYTSACLCVGATASTTTIAPVKTVTSTVRVCSTFYTPATSTVTQTSTVTTDLTTLNVATLTSTSVKTVSLTSTQTTVFTSTATVTKTVTVTVTNKGGY
ncbi:hypothetical protein SBRCBS47491_003620 [Sporothrix bragantina]|uniref:Uncharacterized protein n=1 Tax=Sporothrix bragantina TaxID=671064 RepID=A0ABP0BGZ4_9PEZI